MKEFDQVFKSANAREMGIQLNRIIESHLSDIEGTIAGGPKVKLILYSRNGKNNVLCGIQEGSGDSCMLYVHYVDEIDHPRLKFSGKGKHAKRVNFQSVEEILEEDVRWLLTIADENAPF